MENKPRQLRGSRGAALRSSYHGDGNRVSYASRVDSNKTLYESGRLIPQARQGTLIGTSSLTNNVSTSQLNRATVRGIS